MVLLPPGWVTWASCSASLSCHLVDTVWPVLVPCWWGSEWHSVPQKVVKVGDGGSECPELTRPHLVPPGRSSGSGELRAWRGSGNPGLGAGGWEPPPGALTRDSCAGGQDYLAGWGVPWGCPAWHNHPAPGCSPTVGAGGPGRQTWLCHARPSCRDDLWVCCGECLGELCSPLAPGQPPPLC